MDRKQLHTRPAESGDIAAMVALIEQRRIEYQAYAPVFWRKADNSAQMSTAYFAHLIEASTHTVLVAEANGQLLGFLIAFPTPVPPVFKPGPGPTAMIDDFYLASPDLWPSAGAALMDAVRAKAKEEDWSQLVAVTAHKDLPKTDFLAQQGLSLTSEWWTAPL